MFVQLSEQLAIEGPSPAEFREFPTILEHFGAGGVLGGLAGLLVGYLVAAAIDAVTGSRVDLTKLGGLWWGLSIAVGVVIGVSSVQAVAPPHLVSPPSISSYP